MSDVPSFDFVPFGEPSLVDTLLTDMLLNVIREQDAAIEQAIERMLVAPGDHTVVVYRWVDTDERQQMAFRQEIRIVPTVPPLQPMTVAQMPDGMRPDSAPEWAQHEGEDG